MRARKRDREFCKWARIAALAARASLFTIASITAWCSLIEADVTGAVEIQTKEVGDVSATG